MAKYQNFLSRVGSNRDRAALRGIFSMFLTDDDPPKLKDLTLASIVLSGSETTQITISGACTTGILLSSTCTTAINISGTCTTAISIPNDALFSIGTTTTTAETKITAEFDETTTGIGLFNMGDVSTPMVLNTNPGATVVGHTINILHSAGAGDCADLIGSYVKTAVSGDGDSGTTVVGHASRAYAGTASGSTTTVSQLYGSQPWVSHYGTGAVTAMSALSAKCDVNTGNFTATTVNAGHFHIEGASTVTSSYFDGVMIEVYPDVTCLDAGLRIAVDTGATVANGIYLQGAMTEGLNIACTATDGILITGSCTTGIVMTGVTEGLLIGASSSSPITVTSTGTTNMVEVNSKLTAASGILRGIISYAEFSGTHVDVATNIYAIRGYAKVGGTVGAGNVLYSAGVQGKLELSGTIGGGKHCAVLAQLNSSAGLTGATGGTVYCLWADGMQVSQTPASALNMTAIGIELPDAATRFDSAIYVYGGATYLFDIQGEGVGGSYAATYNQAPAAATGTLKCRVGSTDVYILVTTDPTA